ncbi:hypothetical protein [Paenibacillus sp. HJGM_3]|uniref:hypothetical protein n=1 Tax=Paenibacillus sp. HJGM_3 TaxID=3379816 RepID=UPI00385A9706
MKKWFNTTVALTVAAAVLAACSGSGEPQSSPEASASQTGAQEKLKLDWFVMGPVTSTLPPADKDFIKKTIDAKFNVDLKIDFMANGQDYTNKLNLRISSGEAPDLFMANGVESNKYIQDGVVMDLTNLVTPKTMPNYFKTWVTEDELKSYQVQNVFKRAPVPYTRTLYTSYYIRKDWLDKLGLKMPETYEDMISVMKAFTENDPDGNGKKDTYGFTDVGNGTSIPRGFPEFYKNGLYGTFLIENDRLIDPGTDIRMGPVLDDLKKTLSMNIVDPDWLLNKTGQQVEKAQQGKVGIVYLGYRTAALDNAADSMQKKTKEVTNNPNVDWQPFHPWAKTGVNTLPLPGNPFLINVKTSAAKAKKSIEILDWLASAEGFLLTHYGQAGVHYKQTGNKIEPNPDAFKKDITDNGDFLKVYSFFAPNEPHFLNLEYVDPQETDRDRAILAKIRSYKFTPNIGTSVVTDPTMNLPEMRKQANQVQIKIVTEEKDASNWPKYRQELMTKYEGKKILDSYAAQVSKALNRTITFKSEN